MNQQQSGLMGLYIHIPYCTRLCHYCDFVKTARFAEDEPGDYLRLAAAYLTKWIEVLHSKQAYLFDSLFIGGGTPSLLGREYVPLMELLHPYLAPGAEVTLEANPEHINEEKLKIWAELGVNRLSLGVQSFQDQGLRFLTREHSAEHAIHAVNLARRFIGNVNIDLIYGWQEQDPQLWQADLEQALALGVQHLSLYTLSYEGKTPMARRERRGLLAAAPDERLELMYRLACDRLADKGWLHEEVSNWHRAGFSSVHNHKYWQMGSYVGIGPGAHSFLGEHGSCWGTRWAQSGQFRQFAEGAKKVADLGSIEAILELPGVEQESGRARAEWLIEVVSSGLRTKVGLNLDAICKKTGYNLQPRPVLQTALDAGLLRIDPQGNLTLKEDEWYRETAWALELALSFVEG